MSKRPCHVAQIPPALLREITLNGTPKEVIEQPGGELEFATWC